MNPSAWKQLNKMPKYFRLKTYPELQELCRLKFAAEKAKNITRGRSHADDILTQNENILYNLMDDKATYGTASGSGWLNYKEALQLMVQTLQWADMDFASFYITKWNPETKLWISIKDL